MKPETIKALSRYLFPAIETNRYAAKVLTVWLVLLAVVVVAAAVAIVIMRRF